VVDPTARSDTSKGGDVMDLSERSRIIQALQTRDGVRVSRAIAFFLFALNISVLVLGIKVIGQLDQLIDLLIRLVLLQP